MIKVEKRLRIMRCSFVSYSEEESFVFDSRVKYFFLFMLLKKMLCFVFSNGVDIFDVKWWFGVSFGLDEDDR